MMNAVHKIVLIMIVSGGLVGSAYGAEKPKDQDIIIQKGVPKKDEWLEKIVTEELRRSFETPEAQSVLERMCKATADRIPQERLQEAICRYEEFKKDNQQVLAQLQAQNGNEDVVMGITQDGRCLDVYLNAFRAAAATHAKGAE
jgi:hypothetical protein